MPTLLALMLATAAATPADRPLTLAACPAAELRLVALAETRAFVACGDGPVFEAPAGEELMDGVVGEVTDGVLAIQPSRELRLFAKNEPTPLADDPKFTGERVDIDFQGGLPAFAWLVGALTGLNVVVEGDLTTPVTVAARATPWDHVVAHALAEAGLGYEIERGTILRIGRRGERMLGLPPQPEAALDAQPVSFRLFRASPTDALRVFGNVLGKKIQPPPPPHPELTVYFQDVPLNDAFLLVLASRRWRYRFDEQGGIEVGAIPPTP